MPPDEIERGLAQNHRLAAVGRDHADQVQYGGIIPNNMQRAHTHVETAAGLWKSYWITPACMAAAIALIFFLAFRDRSADQPGDDG